ncbi:MAG: hypothetical protein OXC40_03780, partial [Proteobacteria bacterium]|nr:hypothetical protein [Pseudomonadota bacterium]
MKIFFFIICVIFFVFPSCRSTSQVNLEKTGSKLQFVYDQKHVLRLMKVIDKPGLYHFESCPLTKNRRPYSERCVSALKDKNGDSAMFALWTLENLSLSNEEQKKLNGMHKSW